MYFDPEPKRRKDDFFNMEREMESFLRALSSSKLIIVTGLRRYGKTSLILTGLNEAGVDYVFLDCRLLPSGVISVGDLMTLLEEELGKKSWAGKLLERVEGIRIGDFGIRFRRVKRETLIEVIRMLEGKVLVIDEAQELRRSNLRFDSILAYAFDHLDLRIVVSGSSVGTLYGFLGIDDPSSPLFGRPYVEIKVRKLERREAEEFLSRGFEMEGMKVPERVLEEAVERFGGIIGWLTHFGFSMARGGKSMEEIFEDASKLAAREVENALLLYGIARPRYVEALKVVATLHRARWSDVKRGIEAKLGKIPNNTLSAILRNLVNLGFMDKEGEFYSIADPVLRSGIRYIS